MNILFASDVSFNYFHSYRGDENAFNAMKNTAKYFYGADFSVVNLENILGSKDSYLPIPKSGPNLISDECFLTYIDALHPTCVGLANNHSKDFGEGALLNTIDLLKKGGYMVFGAGKDINEAYEPIVLKKDEIEVSCIAVCENEFGVATEETSGTAGFNFTRVYRAIKKAEKKGQLPIIYFHGGNESNPFPSPGKCELYRQFIDSGAKAVIAMHTHCPQGYEYYKDCPIVYSMGNFFFPDNSPENVKTWAYGYMSLIDISNLRITLEIIPYKFDFEGHYILEGEEKCDFIKYIGELSRPISDDRKIREIFDSWCVICGLGNYAQLINRSGRELLNDPNKIAPLKNLFSCESHDERMKNTLNMIYDGRFETGGKYIPYIRNMQNMSV